MFESALLSDIICVTLRERYPKLMLSTKKRITLLGGCSKGMMSYHRLYMHVTREHNSL